jgi:polysaccharide deacetylase family protein (PEP-CTERM system associated)
MSPPMDILTVDVEEWFHGHNYLDQVPPAAWDAQPRRVEENTDRLLGLFARHGVRGTFFVLGWTAERHPDLVRRIAAAGHEIGCHSYAHPVVFAQSRDAFAADLDRALAALDHCGVQVAGYRAPSFTITPTVHHFLHVLRERGLRYDCSIYPVRHPRYGQPHSPRAPFVLESSGPPFVVVPMPTWRCAGVNVPFSGGGYMRLLPGPVYRVLRTLAARQDQPCVTYLHPWEIDDFRPATRQSHLLRMRSQGGQQTMLAKLENLMQRGHFTTLGEHVDRLLAAGDLPRRAVPLVE